MDFSLVICASRLAHPSAPLAQSVERFHGKEKVTGPIPVGGSKKNLELLKVLSKFGGVAQLGRANGS